MGKISGWGTNGKRLGFLIKMKTKEIPESERKFRVWRLVRQVWFSPTAQKHYFTKRGACIAEARARIKLKYPSEDSENDEHGRCIYKGWYWGDLPRSEVLLKRYARVIFKSLPKNKR